MSDWPAENTCRVCGCTDSRACPEGCYWVDWERTLCSECEPIVAELEMVFGSDRAPLAIQAIGYGLAAERMFGPPHDEDLIAETEAFDA